jgi:hypothetical protein
MDALNELLEAVRSTLVEWRATRFSELQITRPAAGVVLAAALLAIALAFLIARRHRGAQRARGLALPAILPMMRSSGLSAFRHSAFVLFAAGVPFFVLAVADPHATIVRESDVQPGRRIAILIDGSGSMVLPFDAPRLKPAIDRTFYVAVAAADRFIRMRKDEQKNDVIGLIEFGNEAYVVTPFTTDYDNAILSLALVGDQRAWNRFNVFGTTIIQGLAQGLDLFRTFDLLTSPGNMIVIFTDGNDGERMFRGETLDQMMADAGARKIPIYMVRLGFGKRPGDVPYDALWKPAVERTGGRFYAAPDEAAIFRAIGDIDRLSTGSIGVRHYATAVPAFAGYLIVALGLWLAAGTLKLVFPFFATFP